MTDIIDIKPPVEPDPFFLTLLPCLIAVLVILGAALLYRHLRSRRRKQAVEEGGKMLAHAATLPSPDADDVFFYERLSEAARQTLAHRYDLPAIEMTAEEIFPRLHDIRLSIEEREGMEKMLREADRVRFGGRPGALDRKARDHRFVSSWIGEDRISA